MSAMGFVLFVVSFAVLCILPVEGARENKNGVGLQPLLTRDRRDDDIGLQPLLTRDRRDDDIGLQPLLTRDRRDDDVGLEPLLTRDRRDDDVSLQSLLTLVQQQAASIQKQEAVNQRHETVIQQLEAVNQRQATALLTMQAQMTQLQTSVNAPTTQVFFTAHVNYSPVSISDSPLRFLAVSNNVGNGYSNVTGVFRAPESGTYIFFAQLMKYSDTPSITWAINKAGAVLCQSFLEGTYATSSCMGATFLQKGEEVFVRRQGGGGTTLNGGGSCSFSGFRIP